MKKKLLLTGGCGFIGHHLVEGVLKNTDWEIVIIDRLDISGNTKRLMDIDIWEKEKHRVKFLWWDLKAEINESIKREIGQVNYIWHLAASSHVDRSIIDPMSFVMDNVVGTCNLLNFARILENLNQFIYFSCYDEKTRALTKDGMKTYKELKLGDVVFTINPETMQLEEQPIEKIIIQDYNGEMVKFSNGRIDLLVTPNHRMYQADMTVLEANDCVGKKIMFPIPAGFKGKTDISKDLMYLIGVFLGDGFTAYQEKKIKNRSGLTKKERDIIAKDKKTGQFIKTGIIGKNEYVIEKSWRIFLDIPENDKARIKTERTLKNLGISYTKQKGKSGEHLYFSSKEWLEFFNQFGKGAKNKFIPPKFLEYSSEYLEELLNGLMDSDGYWKTKMFTTISDKLADNFCELVIKLGNIPNKQKRYSECIFENRVIKGYSWQINFANQRKAINPKYIIKENYDGKIWCISVKNKNFIVERNGKFAFSGNTDEVFGPAPEGVFYKEWDRYKSGNPYAASKAGAEELCVAFENTYKLPIIITHTMNVYGERQHPEKFIPLTIKKILMGEKMLIHANKEKTKSGSRMWIHARNVCSALLFLTEKGKPGDKYNIVGEKEVTNLDMAQFIAKIVGKQLDYEMIDFHSSRPGHDLRYSLDGSKMKSMGWDLPKTFDQSLEKTVRWTLENKEWLNL